MSITSTKITATKVLQGTTSANALPVKSKDYNKAVDDLTSIDSRVSVLEAIKVYTPTTKTATAVLTAAEVATGYIAVTSATAVALTLPTGTLLGAALGAVQGTVFNLYVDNTASTSSGIVTMVVATDGIQSNMDLEITAATASVTPATVTPLTIPVGVTGLAKYTLMFSSATTYVFTRTA